MFGQVTPKLCLIHRLGGHEVAGFHEMVDHHHGGHEDRDQEAPQPEAPRPFLKKVDPCLDARWWLVDHYVCR
jgi:hypothetical protein